MKNLLRLEELAQFIFCLVCMIMLKAPWWCYGLLLIGPDISMLGYTINSRTGAFCYNIFHHKGVALLVWMAGLTMMQSWENFGAGTLAGIILYGHASMDRIFGYGLKFGDSFHHTHLGWIGKRVANDE